MAVQVEFVALGLMLAGVAAGWWRDGLAACLTLGGWTLFHIAERHVPPWSLFHVAAIVGVLFAVSWAGGQAVRRKLAVVTGLLSFPFLFGITIDATATDWPERPRSGCPDPPLMLPPPQPD